MFMGYRCLHDVQAAKYERLTASLGSQASFYWRTSENTTLSEKNSGKYNNQYNDVRHVSL